MVKSKDLWKIFAIIVISFFALTSFEYQAYTVQLLKEQNEVLKIIIKTQRDTCNGIHRVNEFCEETIVDIMQRLGLDKNGYPLMTTIMWQRAMKGYSVEKAREKLSAPPIVEDKLSTMGMGGD